MIKLYTFSCVQKIYNRFMKNATGSLAILGSGETSPNLVSVHRELLNGLDDSSDIFMIDSPLDFKKMLTNWSKKL